MARVLPWKMQNNPTFPKTGYNKWHLSGLAGPSKVHLLWPIFREVAWFCIFKENTLSTDLINIQTCKCLYTKGTCQQERTSVHKLWKIKNNFVCSLFENVFVCLLCLVSFFILFYLFVCLYNFLLFVCLFTLFVGHGLDVLPCKISNS